MRRSFPLFSTAMAATPALLFSYQKYRNVLEESLRESKKSSVIAHLLLSPHTPPPIAKAEQTANFFIATFDPFVFAYCIFDFAVILDKARDVRAVGLLESPLALLVPPRSLIRNPAIDSRFAPSRLAELGAVLRVLLDEHDSTPRSLVHVAQEHNVDCPQLVPFIRGTCMCAEVSHPLVPQVAYVLDELLSTGFVSSLLHIEGDYAMRQQTLAELLMAGAKEFGSMAVLFTALELFTHQQHPPDATAIARGTSLAFSKEDKRLLDWSLKTRGTLRHGFSVSAGWTHLRK